MIHTTKEEVRIIVYLIIFGIFILSTYDSIYYLTERLKKFSKNLIRIVYSVLIIYITYEFAYKLAYGYVPIHYVLFLTIGFFIYLFFRKKYFISIKILNKIYQKWKMLIKKIVLFLVYPQVVIALIRFLYQMLKKTVKDFLKKNK